MWLLKCSEVITGYSQFRLGWLILFTMIESQFLVYLLLRGRTLRKTMLVFLWTNADSWMAITCLFLSSHKHHLLFQDLAQISLHPGTHHLPPQVINSLSSVLLSPIFVTALIIVYYGYLFRCLSFYYREMICLRLPSYLVYHWISNLKTGSY